MAFVSISAYSISIYIARLTIIELKSRSNNLTSKTKNLQDQVAKTLFFQSLCPLVTSVLPLMCAIIGMMFNENMDHFGDFLIVGVSVSGGGKIFETILREIFGFFIQSDHFI